MAANKFAIKAVVLTGQSDSRRFVSAADWPTAWVARPSSSFEIASSGRP